MTENIRKYRKTLYRHFVLGKPWENLSSKAIDVPGDNRIELQETVVNTKGGGVIKLPAGQDKMEPGTSNTVQCAFSKECIIQHKVDKDLV